MGWKQNRYNKKSAKKYGWQPNWFEADDFNDELMENIKDFQMRHSLQHDGLCGPVTYRHIYSEREAIEDQALEVTDKKYIICDGAKVPVAWDSVVNLYGVNNYALPKNCYRRYKPNKRNVKMIITHFDVCLSAASCKRVLQRKGISSHFVIDNDGTICQMVDPQHGAWHAGKYKVNRAAIGIDISNGFYTKYQSWYRKKGFGKRPVLENVKVHGHKIKECLGFYPIQIEAYKVLVKTLCKYYDIPLEMPMSFDGSVLRAVSDEVVKGKFRGIANHFHVTRGKIDTANLDWDKVLQELKD
tara:strand:+ start:36608 stop:37504 length:897 start_codon:yes stop_codon:yes gene_type:complete